MFPAAAFDGRECRQRVASRPGRADSAFVPALAPRILRWIPQGSRTGVTLLKHLEKLPKRDGRRRLRPAFAGT